MDSTWWLQTVAALTDFMSAGGPVLWTVGAMAALIGFLVFERYWYTCLTFPHHRRQVILEWQRLNDASSWRTQQIRAALISQSRLLLRRRLQLLKGFVALCPLLGLLGTVTGMIQVFDVVAVLGTGNARAMASGISRATIPTMAGLVVALPGLYFALQLDQLTNRQADRLADALRATKERH